MSAVAETPQTVEPRASSLIGAAVPSEAGPIEPAELAGLPTPPAIPWPRAAQILWFGQLQWHFVHHYRDKLGEVFAANALRPRAHLDHLSPRSHPLAVQGPAGQGADDRHGVAAAPGARLGFGADLERPAAPAPAQAAAAAIPRRGDRALPADDRRGRRARDRPLAGRPAVRARAADAGDHARRDHGRDLRDRGGPEARDCGARAPARDPRAAALARRSRARSSPS